MEDNDNEQSNVDEIDPTDKSSIVYKQLLITGSLLQICGYILVFAVSWKLGIGLFLVAWGSNVLHKLGIK